MSWARLVAVGLALGGSLGCAKIKDARAKPPPPKLEIYAFGDAESNGGHALQVVIRAVEEKDFIEDSYTDIAVLVSEPDETVLDVVTVFPGEANYRSLSVEELPVTIGVYGLFNDAKRDWKILIETRGDKTPGAAVAKRLGLADNVRVIEFAADYGSLRDLNDAERPKEP